MNVGIINKRKNYFGWTQYCFILTCRKITFKFEISMLTLENYVNLSYILTTNYLHKCRLSDKLWLN